MQLLLAALLLDDGEAISVFGALVLRAGGGVISSSRGRGIAINWGPRTS